VQRGCGQYIDYVGYRPQKGVRDERASSQGSHGAKEAKDLALGKAKMPRD